MNEEPSVLTSLHIPRKLRAEIQEFRKETGIPMAHIARVAFREFLDKQKAAKEKAEAA